MASQSSFGQYCNIKFSGTVIDADDAQPLGFATVGIIEQNKFTTTDSEGNFVLDSLCEGKIKLSVRHLDCADTSIYFELKTNKKVTIRLPHSSVKLREIDVFGETRQPQFTAPHSSIEGRELSGLKGGALADITGTITGVSSLNTGSTISKPMIHGLQGYRILILNNGIRLEAQQWGSEHAPEIDPFLAKKVTLIKGAGSLRYGSDAIGGVILVEPDELPDSAGVDGEVNLTGNSNGMGGSVNGMLQGGFGKVHGLSWRIQGTLRKQGNIKTPNYFLSTTALQENNFSYTVGYHRKRWGTELFYSQFNTEVGIFSGSHIGNLTDLNNAFKGLSTYDTSSFSYLISRPYQSISHELLKWNYHVHTGKRSRLNLNYAYQYNLRKEFDKDISMKDSIAAQNLPDLDYRIETHFGEAVWDHDNIKNFRGSFGVNYTHQENIYRGRYFIPNYLSDNFGVFGTERYISRKFEGELGIRYDKKKVSTFLWEGDSIINPRFNFENFSLQSGLIIKNDSSSNLHLNSALTWRSPGVNELFANGLHHGAACVEKGDRDLNPERGLNNSLTYVTRKKNYSLEITGYMNYLKNFIYQEPGNVPILTIKGAFPVFYYKQTDALITGVDIDGRYNLTKKIGLTVKAMFLYAENLNTKTPLIYMPSNRVRTEINYQFNTLKRMKNPIISIAGNYVTRQTRTPPGVDYAPAPDAYFLLELRFSTEITLKNHDAIFSTGINNLLNTNYRDYLDRFRYYCDAPGRNLYIKLSVPLKK